jgi:integrase
MARGDGRVFQMKGSSRWWVQYNHRGKQYRESGGKTEAEARRKLRDRLAEIHGHRFAGPDVERTLISAVLDAHLTRQENAGRRSIRTLRVHVKPLRAAFGTWRVVDLTSSSIEDYKRDRLAEGRKPATVNRELEALRGALRQGEIPVSLIPMIRLLEVENVRQGFFTLAEVVALLEVLPDPDVRDLVQWGFLTGMRRGEIAQLEWSMLDRSGATWALRIPGAITKNKAGRAFGIAGDARTVIERRLRARHFDCPWLFHRRGLPMGPFRDLWRNAVKAAGLPPGRLFHDLRRSAVRNLIRSGVDPSIAMKVSGHKTRSMLDRYNVIEETETATALELADAWLSTQPTTRNVTAMAVGEKRARTGQERPASTDEDWCRRWDLNAFPASPVTDSGDSTTENTGLSTTEAVDTTAPVDGKRERTGRVEDPEGGEP